MVRGRGTTFWLCSLGAYGALLLPCVLAQSPRDIAHAGSVISLVQAAIIGEFSSLSSTRPGWPGYASACFRSSAHTLSSLLILVTELGLFLAFTSAQMLLYLCVPQLLLATGATFLNLSLLTSDFFAVAIGTLLFGDEVPGIYAAAFACTVGGLVVFHVKTADASVVVPGQAEQGEGGRIGVRAVNEDARGLLQDDADIAADFVGESNHRV